MLATPRSFSAREVHSGRQRHEPSPDAIQSVFDQAPRAFFEPDAQTSWPAAVRRRCLATDDRNARQFRTFHRLLHGGWFRHAAILVTLREIFTKGVKMPIRRDHGVPLQKPARSGSNKETIKVSSLHSKSWTRRVRRT